MGRRSAATTSASRGQAHPRLPRVWTRAPLVVSTHPDSGWRRLGVRRNASEISSHHFASSIHRGRQVSTHGRALPPNYSPLHLEASFPSRSRHPPTGGFSGPRKPCPGDVGAPGARPPAKSNQETALYSVAALPRPRARVEGDVAAPCATSRRGALGVPRRRRKISACHGGFIHLLS